MKWIRATDWTPLERNGQRLAGRRDASMYDYPGRSGRYHIAVEGKRPACNTTSAMLVDDTLLPLLEVPGHMRCQRSGCRKWWA